MYFLAETQAGRESGKLYGGKKGRPPTCPAGTAGGLTGGLIPCDGLGAQAPSCPVGPKLEVRTKISCQVLVKSILGLLLQASFGFWVAARHSSRTLPV